jgi:hypothetical protein
MIGLCKLCLQDGVDLQNRHFLSKGIYKILRDAGERNPNPYLLTGTTVVQTSRQLTAALLCRACEQRLSKNGETWVLNHCLQNDGRFPLADILASRTPDLFAPENPTKIYCAAEIPKINVSALAYFAASIFWRGSIHPWNDDGSIPVELGPFQERFRQYLMGLESFPKDSSLWLVVREGKEISRLTYAPLGARKDGLHIYKFPMPGLALMLTVSKNVPARHRQKCFVHGPGNPIVVTPLIDSLLMEEAVKLREKSVYKHPA